MSFVASVPVFARATGKRAARLPRVRQSVRQGVRQGARTLLLLVAVLVGSAGVLAATSPAAGATGLVSPVSPNCKGCAGPLVNHGGPVQHHPRVYLVWWGPEWLNNTDMIAGVENLFAVLADGQYNNILTQYYDGAGHVSNEVVFTSFIDKTTPAPYIPGQMSMTDVGNEAYRMLHQNNWISSPDTQVLVFPQPGTTYETGELGGNCGYHGYGMDYIDQDLVFGLVKYAPEADGCDYVSNAADRTAYIKSMEHTAVHEYAEMVTDPQGNAWTANDGNGDEVADLCNSTFSPYSQDYVPPAGGPTVYVTELWSNYSGGCVMAEGHEYASPAAPGKHTVQGLILSKYQDVCGVNGVAGWCTDAVGEPVSEESSISNGAVSYFAGPSSCSGSGPSNSCAAIYYDPGGPDMGTFAIWGGDYFKYLSMGGPTGILSFPVSDPEYIQGGAVSHFASASSCGAYRGPYGDCSAIYSSDAYGNHVVQGGIYYHYWHDFGGATGALGFPTSDETTIAGGAASYFAGGSSGTSCTKGPYNNCSAMYWSSSTGSHVVWGGIYYRYWHDFGEAASAFGFPTSDEVAIAGGAASYFAGGSSGTSCTKGPYNSCSAFYWSAATGTHYVWGGIYYRYWHDFGGPSGLLGFPISDEVAIAGGAASYFYNAPACSGGGPYGSSGALYWSGNTGTHEVHGCIYQKYASVGGPDSKLGFPTSDEYGFNDGGVSGRQSDFEHGYIRFYDSTGQTQIYYYCDATPTCL